MEHLERDEPEVHVFRARDLVLAYHTGLNRFVTADLCGTPDGEEQPLPGALTIGGSPEFSSAFRASSPVWESLLRTNEDSPARRHGGDWAWYKRMARNYVRWPTKGVELFITERCNLRCRYCYVRDNGAVSSASMSNKTLERCIDFAFARGGRLRTVGVSFFGGEPLLVMPLVEHGVAYARGLARRFRKRVRFSVTTNGTLLDSQTVSFLCKNRFGVTLSLDGPKSMQDALRPFGNGRGSYGRVSAGLKRLVDAGISTTIRSTVTAAYPDAAAIYQALRQFEAGGLQLTWAQGRARSWGEYDVLPSESQLMFEQDEHFADMLLEALAGGEEEPYNPFAHTLRAIHTGRGDVLPCGVTRAVTCVDTEGRLYPCHRFVGMHEFVFGSVFDGVDKRLHHQFLIKYFSLRYHCRTCWAHRFCNIRCPWYFASEDGSFAAPHQNKCDYLRKYVELCAWLYYVLADRYPQYLGRVVEYTPRENTSCAEPHNDAVTTTPEEAACVEEGSVADI